MGLIDRKIDQTIKYINPSEPKPPSQNYEEVFPITVFDAVRKSMDDEDSITLTEVLEKIKIALDNKQPIFPNRPANYLMTFAGEAGEVGGIEISQQIPWDASKQRNDRIPTEKAVGDLMFKLGLIDENGNIIDNEGNHVRWADVIGRPILYESTGLNEDGFITQKGTTLAIDELKKSMELSDETINGLILKLDNILTSHINNSDNPHDISLSTIGAVSETSFNHHINEAVNPHNINKEIIGLGNVDNTSDMDKPISNATQEAIDAINRIINDMNNDVNSLNYLFDANYNQDTGILKLIHRNGSTIELRIPIHGLVSEIKYDNNTKELIIEEVGGAEKRISTKELFIRYLGSTSSNISVTIEGDQTTGNQVIHAIIEEESITDKELADNSVITRILADQSVTSTKIKDLSITTIKLADNSVTTEKIDRNAIVNQHLSNRSVNGRTLFSSEADNRVLAVFPKGSDPVWTQVTSYMMADNSVVSRTIANQSIKTSHIEEGAITNSKIQDSSISEEKIVPGSLTSNSIKDNSISGNKLESDITIPGTPSMEVSPADDSASTEIASTKWVLDRIKEVSINNKNLEKRIVNGSNLFSSSTNDKVLVVKNHDTDPIWGLINNNMLEENSITTKNIMDNSISNEKIKDKSISSRNYIDSSILESHISESAISMEKIIPSNNANMVLASIKENSHPEYTKVTKLMMDNNSIGTSQIEDKSVTLSKIDPSVESNRILVTGLKNTNARWAQATNPMIGNRAIDGRTLFTTDLDNMVLGVQVSGTDPMWTKINSGMIGDEVIDRNHIKPEAIYSEHLHDEIIDYFHIIEGAVRTTHIYPRAVTGSKLFTSKLPNMILGVGNAFMDPEWTKVSSEFIEDEAITKEKLFRSKLDYRILATTKAGNPPEYMMLTNDFILDKTIAGNKIADSVVLSGNPEMTVHPDIESNNFQMADTAWVRKIVTATIGSFNIIHSTWVNDKIEEAKLKALTNKQIEDAVTAAANGFSDFTDNNGSSSSGSSSGSGNAPSIPGTDNEINEGISDILAAMIPLQGIDAPMIKNNSIDGSKLFRSSYEGPRVLAVTGKNKDAEYLPINEKIIEDGGVTSNKLQRDITLLGHPELEIRPQPNASDISGGGSLIPDCQWVLDRINDIKLRAISNKKIERAVDLAANGFSDFTDNEESSGGSGGTGSSGGSGNNNFVITEGSITTELIMKRAVDGSRLFTSRSSNKVLAVISANSDPIYTTINANMLDDKIIDGSKMVSSEDDNRVIGVKHAGDDPEYLTINHHMLEDNVIDTNNIMDDSISREKIMNGAIDRSKLGNEPMIDESLIIDMSITNRKIAENSITGEKILDGSITSNKLGDDIKLSGNPTVNGNTSYEIRSIRNIIISPNKPSAENTNAQNGDIWFQYI